MCPGGSKCGQNGTCVAATNLLGCTQAGNRCWTCAYARMTTEGEPVHMILIYDARGGFAALVLDGAETDLQLGDLITGINSIAPEAEFFEMLAKSEGQPMNFMLSVYRGGKLLTINHKRG